MSELPEPLSAALRTLAGAIDRLEAAAERRVEADAARADLDLELTVMADDRARLARELDASQARSAAMASANAEVSRRLDHASATLHAMLATRSAPSSEAED